MHGRATTGHHGPSQSPEPVRMGPHVLRRHSSSSAGHRPALPDVLLCSALFEEERRTTGLNKGEGRGLSEELVTPLNSAKKDIFALVEFVKTTGSLMQDLHSFLLIF